MNTQKQIAVMVALMFLFVGGCTAYTVIDLPTRAVDQTQWHYDQSIERGALLFANNCRTCHGIKGEGNVGPLLNKPEFKDQDPLVLTRNRALIKRTLQCGRAGTLMPAWLNTNGGSLNDRQLEHLVDLITSPATKLDEDGNATSRGWLEAVEFAHNLNRETILVVGGDTLSTIAREHELGIKELQSLNPGHEPDQVLKKGLKITLPASAGRAARTYEIKKDRETLRKIADGQSVGAMVLADLNGIGYKVDKKTAALSLSQTGNLTRATGLVPGAQIKLPEGATYTIKAGQTIESIAALHNISTSDFTGLNRSLLSTTDAKKDLEYERRLTLPANAVAVVQTGQTPATIAVAHGLKLEDLKTASGDAITAATVVGAGQQLKLPADTRYIIQTGDTLEAVARAHGISEADFAGLNKLKPGVFISPAIVLALPKVDKYAVQGQDLTAIAKTLSGVTPTVLGKAQKPPVEPNFVYAIGTPLIMPPQSYGSAPPDAKNPGTACVENAVPQSKFGELSGTVVKPAPPTTISRDVLLEGNSNDWTLTADGAKQAANKGAVSVAAGARINFKSLVGLHTVTVNGKKEVDQFAPGASYQFTAQTGEYKMTCDFHPDMLAYVFVQ